MGTRGIPRVGLLAFLLAGAARGEAWTNAAGHAIQAELIRLDGAIAVFKPADGSRLELPLTSLNAESRARAEAQWKQYRIPDAARGEYDQCVRTLRRLRTLREGEKMDANDFTIRRQSALSGFRAACARLQAEGRISPEDAERILFLAGTN